MERLTAALAAAATSEQVVGALADHVLEPFGADGLTVAAIAGDRLKIVGDVGYDQDFLARFLEGASAQSMSIPSQVLRARTPLFAESPAELLRLAPSNREMMEASGKNAWVFLPLVATDRSIGICVITFREPTRFTDADRTLLTALSGLVAHALERARLFDLEHARAQALQRALLPPTLPSLPAADLAARYLPASHLDDVGGDWYDAIALSANRIALVVGDVFGHGIGEAATMGMIRTAVRTLAELDLPPDEVLSRLNTLVAGFGDDSYATCLYAVFDPVTRRCSIGRAGHPPPLIVDRDGTVRVLELDSNPPLGAAEPPFETCELQLPDESLLVLYTDGLIDSARSDVDDGLQRMSQLLEGGSAAPVFAAGDRDEAQAALEALCATLTGSMLEGLPHMADDVALLIAHTYGTPVDDVASRELVHDPIAAREARGYVRDRLAQWGLDEIEDETELIVSELVGNAVRHAQGPIRLRLIYSSSLICEVYDASLTSPHIRRATDVDEGGRGLQLVAAVSQRWGARYLDDGKCIWAEQSLPHGK